MNYPKTRRSRVLVVDDERSIALTLSAILEDADYEVRTAFSGEEAVETAAIFHPDLLLTDIAMGTMNGIDAALRITAAQPGCRVLFLSGHAAFCEILKSPPAHLVYSSMSKPTRVPDLLNAIAYMLPAASDGGDGQAVGIEHDPMRLRDLARTALARLDECRNASNSRSGECPEPVSTSSGGRGRIELVRQPSTPPTNLNSWPHTGKRAAVVGLRAMPVARAVSPA